MKNFKFLSPSTVEAVVTIQERDQDGKITFDCAYNLRHDDLADLLQTVKDYHDSLEDLYYNPRNKEALDNRFSKAVSSV